MKKNYRAEFKADSVDLVNFIIRHFKTFIITGLAAAIISAAVSLALKPLYESTVVLYPSSNVAETQNLLGEASSSSSAFGDDDATERLLQILKSDQVKGYLKEKYDLMSHYHIRAGERYPNTQMALKMKKYIRSSKTSFGSVEISVRDRDRNIACQMANDIASRADTIFNAVQRENATKLLGEINKSYELQLRLVRSYEDSLKILAGSGSYGKKASEEKVYDAYYYAAVSGNDSDQGRKKTELNLLKTGSPEFLRIFSTLESETEYLSLIRGRYLESYALSHQTLPYTLVVDQAVVAEKKVWPKRSYMVIIATTSALLLLALLLFISDSLVLHREEDGRE